VLWINTDEPVNTGSAADRRAEEEVLAALDKAL
jgi:hypothetical protein